MAETQHRHHHHRHHHDRNDPTSRFRNKMRRRRKAKRFVKKCILYLLVIACLGVIGIVISTYTIPDIMQAH